MMQPHELLQITPAELATMRQHDADLDEICKDYTLLWQNLRQLQAGPTPVEAHLTDLMDSLNGLADELRQRVRKFEQ